MVRSYWSEQFIAGNETEKSSDEPPTDQEHRPGDRADQAHRVQLTARSIISFDCLIVGEISFCFFCFLFLRKFLLSSSVFLQQQSAVCDVDRMSCSSDVCLGVYKLSHRLT